MTPQPLSLPAFRPIGRPCTAPRPLRLAAPAPRPEPPGLDREEPEFVDEPDLPPSEPPLEEQERLGDLPGDDSDTPPEPTPESDRQPGQDDPQEVTPTGGPS